VRIGMHAEAVRPAQTRGRVFSDRPQCLGPKGAVAGPARNGCPAFRKSSTGSRAFKPDQEALVESKRIQRKEIPMEIDRNRLQALAGLVGLGLPESDLEPIAIRSELLGAMEAIERELGAEMDAVDPIPPVFPHPDW
jgi:hypothetical protein